jgi:hypothetical protein
MTFARPEIERAVLGNLLLNPEWLPQVRDLVAEDFSLSSNGSILSVIREMSEAGEHIESLTVINKLRSRGQLEKVGGHDHVAGLLVGVTERPNIKEYVKILKDSSNRRRLIHGCHAAAKRAEDESVPADECIADLEKLSAQYREVVRAERKRMFETAAEISSRSPRHVDWIVRPWVATASMTNVSGKVKAAGKTTWILRMVASVLDCRSFMGEPTCKTPVVYLSEQPAASLVEALKGAGLLERQDLSLLLWNKAVGCSWPEVVRSAIEESKRLGARLLVVDTLHQFAQIAGDAENNAGDALEAVRPLQKAMAEGIAVVLVVHDRKSGGDVGESGRGSSAFSGAADILISLRRLEGNGRPTLRQIQALSRFSETPREVIIELTPDGYVARGEAREVAAAEAEAEILSAVPSSEAEATTIEKLTETTGVSRATAQRVMDTLVTEGRLQRNGKGKRGDPFRYFLPEIGSAQTSSSHGQIETMKADTAAQMARAPDTVESCPWCAESDWWFLPDGGRVCGVCHPKPLEEETGSPGYPSLGHEPRPSETLSAR